jgi:hypothetical protein
MATLSATAIAVSLSMALPACAGHTVPEAPGPDAVPHVSWRLLEGALEGGDDDEVCRSDAPIACVLDSSTPSDPRAGVVSVFLHAAGVRTTFTGAVLAGFMDGSSDAGYELNVRDYGVDPEARPSAVSVAGRVVNVPGDYVVRIALLARVPERRDPYPIAVTIPVTVRPAHIAEVRATTKRIPANDSRATPTRSSPRH